MEQTSQVTIVTFVIYIIGILLLATISHRFLSGKSFLSEYFLGSRGLGSWALAFTFAATAASGGSFTGFPSLIYSYGWVLAFWIASYMVVPLCTMGVMGKRLNQVARKTGAITVPDVLRDRYDSAATGLFASCTIVFFTVSNLVAQFKAGALIVEETFNLPESWGYLAGLGIFAGVVVIYTAYGGFRAVVWTDVVQGVFMGIGVVILLPIVLSLAGGPRQVFEKIRNQPPALVTSIPGQHNDLVFLLRQQGPQPLPVGVEYRLGTGEELRVDVVRNSDGQPVIRVLLPPSPQLPVSARQVKDAVEREPLTAPLLLSVEYAYENDGSGTVSPMALRRFTRGQNFLFGPGREPDGTPFHPFGMTLSFSLIWAISGMGQPGTMVRLIAFRDSRTLKRAIVIVTVYYGLIYLPLVWIFVTARTLLPYLPQESSDKAMVLVPTRLVGGMGLGYEILAAIFVAAPFAAIMSTVDSFLLMISSSLVRDIYQKNINPQISQRAVRWASYATTSLAGVLVTLLATQRIDFLQYIVVFAGVGFASSFLFPTLLGLYWRDMTRQGAISSMVGGFVVVVLLFAPSLFGGGRINLFGLHPIVWGLSSSAFLAVFVSKFTGPPPEFLVRRYFKLDPPTV